MNESIDLLLQQEVDGTNTSQESAQLNQAIKSNPEIQARLDEYRGLSVALGARPMAEPPADFTERVMHALPTPALLRSPAGDRSAASRRQVSFLDRIFAPRVQVALAFACGVLIAVVGTMAVLNPEVDAGAATGTIAAVQQIDFPGGAVRVEDFDGGTRIVARVPEGAEMIFAFDANVQPTGISWTGDSQPSVVVDAGQIVVADVIEDVSISFAGSDSGTILASLRRDGMEDVTASISLDR